MLLITLNISSNQTKSLRFKIAREAFNSNYNVWLLRAITTNNAETKLMLYVNDNETINPTNQPMAPLWPDEQLLHFEEASQVDILKVNWLMNDALIIYNTEQWGCIMLWSNDLFVTIEVGYRADPDSESICYTLDLSSCKIKQWCPTIP